MAALGRRTRHRGMVGALLWLAWMAMIYTNLATIALGEIVQRAQLTRAQENQSPSSLSS